MRTQPYFLLGSALRLGTAVLVGLFVWLALSPLQPAFGQAGGTVSATVEVDGTCLTLSTNAIDYGVRAFSTNGGNVTTAAAGPQITNCAPSALDVAVSGSGASGTNSAWQLTDLNNGSLSVCGVGTDLFGHVVSVDANAADGPVDLSGLSQPLASAIPAAASVNSTGALTMPCSGSSGAGEVMSFSIVFVGTTSPGGTLQTFYLDLDGDGYGDDSVTWQATSAPTSYVAVGGDCNDADVSINPDAIELPDGLDNDCDGLIDEDLLDGSVCDDGNPLTIDIVDSGGCVSQYDAAGDFDGDGLANGQEDLNLNGVLDPGETDPLNWDTDGDSAGDGFELQFMSMANDTDGDGIPDGPLDADSDGDGIPDGLEPFWDLDNDGSINPLDQMSNGINLDAASNYELCNNGIDDNGDLNIDEYPAGVCAPQPGEPGFPGF